MTEIDDSTLTGAVAERIDADLILWHNANEAEVSRLMGTGHTVPRVLATVADGRDASLWQLKPHRTELGAVSPSVLVDTIRAGISPSVHPSAIQESPWPNN